MYGSVKSDFAAQGSSIRWKPSPTGMKTMEPFGAKFTFPWDQLRTVVGQLGYEPAGTRERFAC